MTPENAYRAPNRATQNRHTSVPQRNTCRIASCENISERLGPQARAERAGAGRERQGLAVGRERSIALESTRRVARSPSPGKECTSNGG